MLNEQNVQNEKGNENYCNDRYSAIHAALSLEEGFAEYMELINMDIGIETNRLNISDDDLDDWIDDYYDECHSARWDLSQAMLRMLQVCRELANEADLDMDFMYDKYIRTKTKK